MNGVPDECAKIQFHWSWQERELISRSWHDRLYADQGISLTVLAVTTENLSTRICTAPQMCMLRVITLKQCSDDSFSGKIAWSGRIVSWRLLHISKVSVKKRKFSIFTITHLLENSPQGDGMRTHLPTLSATLLVVLNRKWYIMDHIWFDNQK